MEYQIEDISQTLKQITAHFTAEELKPMEEKILQSLQQTVNIPGFRKGKVPLTVIRRKFSNLVHNELLEEAIESAVQQVRNDHPNWTFVVATNIVEHKHLDNGDLQLIFNVEVMPEVELDDRYKTALTLNELPAIQEGDVDQTIEDIRQHYGHLETQEGAIDSESIVTLELQKLDPSGLPIIGEKPAEPLQLPVEAISDENLKSQIVGKSKGDEFVYTFTSPDGESQQYRVRITEVQRTKPAELTEEKIAEITGGAAHTPEELRDHIRQALIAQRDEQQRKTFEAQIREQLLALYGDAIEIPPRLLQTWMKAIADDQKVDLEQLTPEQLAQWQKELEQQIKWIYIRSALINKENITVSEEDWNNLVLPIGEQQLVKWTDLPEEIKAQLRPELKDSIVVRKLMDRLIELATITQQESQDDQPQDDQTETEQSEQSSEEPIATEEEQQTASSTDTTETPDA